ncbi:hypothetical protein F4781DRAFT_402837 [Annulohypoxylon bovei var. microspora]|nr:hypothetical protein F4781DRAFT_402837 [Annulohypoxylon bovei var. microspora]
MWFRLLATLIFMSSVTLGHDVPGPGEPALVYADGAFTEPRGSQSTYTLRSTMNISWQTTYETSNLWLIVNWSYNTPIQLASNVGQRWYQWEVATDSTNSSAIYAFRIVNALGTAAEQENGGFMSAAFWIDGLSTTSISSSSTPSRISTSASAPVTAFEATATSSATTSQATESVASGQPSGLTDSAKVGVGVGVGIGGFGFLALVVGILLYRRSQNGKTQGADHMEPYLQAAPPTYFNNPASLYYNEHYKPPIEMGGMGRSAELDARQFSDPTRSHPAELQG